MPPEIIGHRGAPRARRENTLAAFEAAIAEGADALELDVHATKDGVVVVHHDFVLGPTVRPAVHAGAPLAALDWTALRDVALLADDAEAGVPSLADVIAQVGTRARLYVEVKGRDIERRCLDLLRDVPGAAIHAFDHRIARTIREAGAPVPTGILVDSRLLEPARALRAAGARDYWCGREFVDRETVAEIHGAGGRVVAWTVNDPARARELAALGVDAICTDVPRLARQALQGASGSGS